MGASFAIEWVAVTTFDNSVEDIRRILANNTTAKEFSKFYMTFDGYAEVINVHEISSKIELMTVLPVDLWDTRNYEKQC